MNWNPALLRLVGGIVVRQITRRIRENRITPKTQKAGTTLVNRNLLMRSIRQNVSSDAVIISAGNASVPYAKIHHTGGVIKPKNAKYLAIPLTPMAKLYSPRSYPSKTFIAKGIIFQSVPGGSPVPLYKLQKQVEIPERRYMYIDENDSTVLRNAVANYLRRQNA